MDGASLHYTSLRERLPRLHGCHVPLNMKAYNILLVIIYKVYSYLSIYVVLLVFEVTLSEAAR
jgi:hypothetical protein